MISLLYKRKCVYRKFPINFQIFTKHTQTTSTKKKYSHTVLLPKTTFPNYKKISLKDDEELQQKCKFFELYNWQKIHNTGPSFVLHDGPPYANGDLHLGHAINKILKDITLRYKILRGFKVDYLPGWDCHGLPIEIKVTKNKDTLLTPLEIRKQSKDIAFSYIEKQMKTFKRWGVLGNWDNYYCTNNPAYIANQLHCFHQLYERGLIYQDNMPVFWSPANHTALAEAELEYNPEHVSTSLILKVKLSKITDIIQTLQPKTIQETYALIWTTTPWTIPANQAVCYNPGKSYLLLANSSNEAFLISEESLPFVKQKLNMQVHPLATFPGHVLQHCMYSHPFHAGRECLFLGGTFVDPSRGTGLVHTAPNHGKDDYANCMRHQMSLDECLVDENGCFTAKAGEDLAGLKVLEEGNEKVLEKLGDLAVKSEPYVHSYPYDWRSKTPVITRSSKQWFIDVHSIRETAVQCLSGVKIVPESARDDLMNHIKIRPPWCISRQRSWGVPIPVFHDESGRALLSKQLVEHFSLLVREHGSDFWWELPTDRLFPPSFREKLGVSPMAKLTKGTDIMDIWFDSGVSWSSVLKGDQVADLYLEGIDQVRGWFQSSLLTSVALRGKAPYKSIFLHGFALDEKYRKMSKSLGNVIDPQEITDGSADKKALGADTLRWWVARHASNHQNTPARELMFEESSSEIHKVRIVARFIMGSLHDFDSQHRVPYSELNPVDQYLLHAFQRTLTNIASNYDEMKYYFALSNIVQLATSLLSSFYCHIIKYRLYCSAADDPSRRSCQTALQHVLDHIVQAIAPIIPHLAEEITQHLTAGDSVFKHQWQDPPAEWNNPHIDTIFNHVLKLRDACNRAHDPGFNLKQEIGIWAYEPMLSHLRFLQPEVTSSESPLCEVLQASRVTLAPRSSSQAAHQATLGEEIASIQNEDFSLAIYKVTKSLCLRCRRYTAMKADDPCDACLETLDSYKSVCS